MVTDLPRWDEIEFRTDPRNLLCALESDNALFRADQLRRRLIALDNLDAAFGGLDFDPSARCIDSRVDQRAKVLRMRLEAANAELYESVRSDIVRGGQPGALREWLGDPASDDDSMRPRPGLGFDYSDELLSGVLRLSEPGGSQVRLPPEMVPYQPTPVRHILHMIAAAAITENDIFVDLGSGLGHVPLLVSMMTEALSLGVEVEEAYVVSARTCAQSLHLSRVQFAAQDARDADLSRGTVFYLYSPFKGSILDDVLSALRKESMRRSIKICSLGPCSHRVSNETWLKASSAVAMEHLTVFDSR